MKSFLKTLLFPFAILYDAVTKIRNFLFDKGIFKVYEPPVFSIGVGNLSVGGTGKTPFISYLIKTFPDKKIAILSRGYGRKTKGYIEVNQEATTDTVGDEILMLYQRHESTAKFFVSENRKLGIENILLKYPETDLILFDDIYQHRKVKPAFLVLLSTFDKPFFKDFLLPMGRLREARSGAKRADAVIITKAQSLHEERLVTTFLKQVKKYGQSENSLFFNKQVFAKLKNDFGKALETDENVKLISGIANNHSFEVEVTKYQKVIEKHFYPDHHSYTRKNLDDAFKLMPNAPLVTTEKDYVKLKYLLTEKEKEQVYVLKLESAFIKREDEFLRNIKTSFKSFQEQKGSLNNG
ncbi:tetraacyldisaccharide 4'-kinase [Arcticibacterium luteifluviistationis]|uniref:Tetraacyldisaccharide 4'-kinase n=1 Tax=Arcticibacterium luteifluviistationis TaxID=1784714 RepID=A0A2Z4G6W3_9BACT|nr:tetraacyldisaccharide 4'-kinase [Arcticibacterium luteifluviistationis]AWV96896.1 tetraacyldisaccharide 4'-kinase [Arcticibacterium luteifluviistationis]